MLGGGQALKTFSAQSQADGLQLETANHCVSLLTSFQSCIVNSIAQVTYPKQVPIDWARDLYQTNNIRSVNTTNALFFNAHCSFV